MADQIKKTQTVGEVVSAHPEVIPVLTQAGLHCIGCHVSEFESIEEGCMGHGMTKQQIEDLMIDANKKIAEHDKKPAVAFTQGAVDELLKRLKKEKKKYIRLVQNLGEFDFEGTDVKEKGDVVIEAKGTKGSFTLVADPKLERMLKGIKVDYDPTKKDFDASRVS